ASAAVSPCLLPARLRLLCYITFHPNGSSWCLRPSFETRPAGAPQDEARTCCTINKLQPHPEERGKAERLEGWPQATAPHRRPAAPRSFRARREPIPEYD